MGVETAIIVATLAATAYSVDSTLKAGKQAQLNASAQADQAAADANTERSAAVVQAERIRKLARIQAGEANAALAGSGVEVGAGTAININEEITRNSEEDAALTIFGGANKAQRLNADASNYKIAGDQARNASYSQAANTVLAGGTSAYSNWKSSTKAKS